MRDRRWAGAGALGLLVGLILGERRGRRHPHRLLLGVAYAALGAALGLLLLVAVWPWVLAAVGVVAVALVVRHARRRKT